MRVYFLSHTPAFLKLGGLPLGRIDGILRQVRLPLEDHLFAELLPEREGQPLRFCLDEQLLTNPPEQIDLYNMPDGLLLYAHNFLPLARGLHVHQQIQQEGLLFTLFEQGGTYLSVEGKHFHLHALPAPLAQATINCHQWQGKTLFSLFHSGILAILSQEGELLFLNRVTDFAFDDYLTVHFSIATCNEMRGECRYTYDEQLHLYDGKLTGRALSPQLIHFAFFESLLLGADVTPFLHKDLLPKAQELKIYLGQYVDVIVPTEAMEQLHPNERMAGLVYPKAKQIYDVRYYAVTLTDGKIDNLFPIE